MQPLAKVEGSKTFLGAHVGRFVRSLCGNSQQHPSQQFVPGAAFTSKASQRWQRAGSCRVSDRCWAPARCPSRRRILTQSGRSLSPLRVGGHCRTLPWPKALGPIGSLTQSLRLLRPWVSDRVTVGLRMPGSQRDGGVQAAGAKAPTPPRFQRP